MKSEFDRRGVSIVAISVDDPEASLELAERLELTFPLLHDPELRVATDYGVATTGYGTTDRSDAIAGPAVLLISPERAVLWKSVGERYSDLPAGEEVLAQVEAWESAQR